MQRLLFIAAFLGFGATACSYYDTSLLAPSRTAPRDAGPGLDGSVDVHVVGEADAPGDAASAVDASKTCDPVHPVSPPSKKTDKGDISFVVVLSHVGFGEGKGGANHIGFDLDGMCTCHGDGESCRRPEGAADLCDGPGGQDNAAGVMFVKVAQLVDNFGPPDWNRRIQQGQYSLMFRISGYNGMRNDDQVRLEWFVPYHFYGDGKPEDGPNPAWDGNDKWPIRSTCLKPQTHSDGSVSYDLDHPMYYDDHAYVADGWLVGTVNKGTMRFDDNLELEIVGGVVQARVVKDGERWKLADGVITGRWPTRNALGALAKWDDPYLKMPLCTDNRFYPKFKQTFCAYADILSEIGAPSLPCDALSLAMGFESEPASLGDVKVLKPKPRPCKPEVDPANDSCFSNE